MMQPNTFYHIYGRGNKDHLIFFNDRNFQYFKRKLHAAFINDTHIFAYCLLPNAFHLLIHTNTEFNPVNQSQQLGRMLSSYTKGLQKQENFIGSLFRQNTKQLALLTSEKARTCFHQIHCLPILCSLADEPQAWLHSSFNEYYLNQAQLCNTTLAHSLLKVPQQPLQFLSQSQVYLPPKISR